VPPRQEEELGGGMRNPIEMGESAKNSSPALRGWVVSKKKKGEGEVDHRHPCARGRDGHQAADRAEGGREGKGGGAGVCAHPRELAGSGNSSDGMSFSKERTQKGILDRAAVTGEG